MSFDQAECKREPLILLVIRNAQTRSHLRGWYVGGTDEPLSLQGQSQVKFAAAEISAAGLSDAVSRVYVSPLLRSRQTASVLFPAAEQVVVDELRERSFGAFEATELSRLGQDPAYAQWLESDCDSAPPQGEAREVFQQRAVAALSAVLDHARAAGESEVVMVAHGEVIKACFSGMADEPGSYQDWHAAPCGGYVAEARLDRGGWTLRGCAPFARLADVLSDLE
ncbi:MAG: histidine phosphatase family protein [Eggerthellaceae bacterium]